MRRLARHLLTLCSAASLLLCVAVCVLWVRSYSGADTFQYATDDQTAPVPVSSSRSTPMPGVVRADPHAPVAGHWEGYIEGRAGKTGVVVDCDWDAGQYRVEVLVSTWAAEPFEADAVRADGQSLRFQIGTEARDRHVFDCSLKDGKLEGTWTDFGGAAPLLLKRGAVPEAHLPRRPQLPRAPFPYESRDVVIDGGATELHGSLTVPGGAGPHAAVLLLSGSGIQNRDYSHSGHMPYWVLADHLSRRGVVVLRCDDRGFGEAPDARREATVPEEVSDAVAAVAFLKGRPEVDASRIGIVGHSRGAVVAILAATKARDVRFVSLLACPGTTAARHYMRDRWVEVGRRIPIVQARAWMTMLEKILTLAGGGLEAGDAAEEVRQYARAVIDSVPAGRDREVVRLLIERDLDGELDYLLDPAFRSLVPIDPAAELAKLDIPVLVINGMLDASLPPWDHIPPLRLAVAESGNAHSRVVAPDAMNHMMQTCPLGNPEQYRQVEETVSPFVLEAIENWIGEVTADGEKIEHRERKRRSAAPR